MLSIKPPSPYLTTRTIARAIGAESGDTLQSVAKAVAEYDKECSAAVAGALALPTIGVSLVCYDLHHATQAKEKLEATYALAREIVPARITSSSGSASKFKAGGFIFTEVMYQNVSRVEVKRASTHARAQTIKELCMLEEEVDVLEERSSWWENVKQWLPFKPEPVLRLPGEMTLQDLKSRAANLIITKTQTEARQHILAYQKTLGDKENDIITMVGIYALAEVSPPSKKGSRSIDGEIQERIQQNRDSVNILKGIFGFSKPDPDKRLNYLVGIQHVPDHFGQSKDPNDSFTRRHFPSIINCCFNALCLYYKNFPAARAGKEDNSLKNKDKQQKNLRQKDLQLLDSDSKNASLGIAADSSLFHRDSFEEISL